MILYTRSKNIEVSTVRAVIDLYKRQVQESKTSNFHKGLVIELLENIEEDIKSNVGYDVVHTVKREAIE